MQKLIFIMLLVIIAGLSGCRSDSSDIHASLQSQSSPKPPPSASTIIEACNITAPKPSEHTPKAIDLQDYIGRWIGYAILVFEFLEITNATERYITFLYSWCEDEYKKHTLPVVDNQVSFLHEWTISNNEYRSQLVTLEFVENAILLSRFTLQEDEWIYLLSWGLRPIEEFGSGHFASY